MWQALIFILLKMCLYISTVKIICTDIVFKFPEAILERFIHILALHLDLQMSVGESLDCVSDYRGLVSVIFFNFSNR